MLVFFSITVKSQIDLSGKYWSLSCGYTHGYFLRLFPDSIAHYTPIYEFSHQYSRGTWRTSNDTLVVEFPDSIECQNKTEYFRIIDSLTLEKINKAPCVYSNSLYRMEAYYPNGDIRFKIEYGLSKDGLVCFDGRIYFYYPEKILKQVIEYKKGKKHGVEINFTWYGYAQNYGYWKNGLKHGMWLYYDEDFNLIGSEKFKKGKLISGSRKSVRCFPGLNIEIIDKLFFNNY